MSSFIRKLIPPLIMDIRDNVLRRRWERKQIRWTGNYPSWKEAAADSMGYNADVILKKTKDAILKVKNGEAVYERDSVLLAKPEYSWPLITWLLKIGMANDNVINVLDFGGSLGSSYFQNRNLLKPMKLLWSVCEQEHYISVGNDTFADDQLKFYHSIDDCIKDRHPDTLLLSGVIQCLDEPYAWLDQFLAKKFGYIIFDRTAFTNAENDRLTVQHVPASIYEASYPAWFFNYRKFLSYFKDQYELVAEFESHQGFVTKLDDKTVGFYKGFVLKRKS